MVSNINVFLFERCFDLLFTEGCIMYLVLFFKPQIYCQQKIRNFTQKSYCNTPSVHIIQHKFNVLHVGCNAQGIYTHYEVVLLHDYGFKQQKTNFKDLIDIYCCRQVVYKYTFLYYLWKFFCFFFLYSLVYFRKSNYIYFGCMKKPLGKSSRKSSIDIVNFCIVNFNIELFLGISNFTYSIVMLKHTTTVFTE